MYHPEKISYKNVNAIIKNTAWDFSPFKQGEQAVEMALLGYFTPSQANWSYAVGITLRGGKAYAVVKQFGGIVGALELHTGSEA